MGMGIEREQERSEIQELAKTDVRACINALRECALKREKCFVTEGWRKAKSKA
jgi:hypothetical protein